MHFVFWDVTIKKFYTSFQDHGDIGGKPTTSVELTVAINLFKARCLKHLTNARKSIDYELEKLMVSIKELERSWVRVPRPNEARITSTVVQGHPCELSKYHPSFLHSPRQIKNLFFLLAIAPPPECATPAPLDFSPPSFELIPDIACKEDLVEQSRNKNKRKKFNYEQVEPRALKFSPQRQEEAKVRFTAKAKASDTCTGPHLKCPWDHNQLPMRRDFNAAQSFYKWVTDPMNSNDRYQLYSNILAHQ